MQRLVRIFLAGALVCLSLLCPACADIDTPEASDSEPVPTASGTHSTIMPVSQSASDQLARIVRPLTQYLSEHGLTSAVLTDIPNEQLTNYLFSGILDWQEIYDDRNANSWSGEPLVNLRLEALDFELAPLTDSSVMPETWGNIFNGSPAAPAYTLDAAAVAQVMTSVIGRPVSVDEIMAGLIEFAGWDGMAELRDGAIAAPYLMDPAPWNVRFISEQTDGQTMDVTYEYDLATEGTRGEMTLHLVPDDASMFGARVESIALHDVPQ